MPRGRPRKNKSTLPPCYRESHGAVYHIHKNVWRRVGTAADAHAEYAEKLRQGKQGGLDPFIDAAFARMKARTTPKPLAKSTVGLYTRASRKLKHHMRAFARPDQVKQKDAAALKVLMAKIPIMANHVLSFATSIFAEFVEHQLCDSNPFLGIKRYPTTKRTRLILQAEWDAIYAKAPARLQCVMDGLYLTDQRIGDVLKIDEKNILDDGPGIYFRQEKTGKELIVAWNPQLREWVARCRALHGNVVQLRRARPLFRARGGALRAPSYRTVYDQWCAAVERADVDDCNLHDNRAFSATDAQRQGLDPQKLLGHEDAKTTKIYLRGREIAIVQGPQMKRSA